MKFFLRCACCVALLNTVGCSRELSRVVQPKYSTSAGEQAISLYDTNRDNALSGAELDSVGALKTTLEQVDSDQNGSLTAAEINARVNAWVETKIAEMPVRCELFLDGQPLADAQVVFEPEPFLGSALKKASGVSTASGDVGISMDKQDLADANFPGVACGWYKIRVTSTTQTIPERYNTATTLGCEVAVNASWLSHGAVQLQLQSQ